MKQVFTGLTSTIAPEYILPHGTVFQDITDDYKKREMNTTSDLDKFHSAVMEAIELPNIFSKLNDHADSNSTGDTASIGDDSIKVKEIVERYWPEENAKNKVEYYNALKTCINSSTFFLQHSRQREIQVRVVQFTTNRLIKYIDGFIYINQLGNFFEEIRNMYKQATNIKFIGSIVNVRNTSINNGNYIDITCAQRTSDSHIANTEMYDTSGELTSISNRDKYTKFIPPTRYEYSTKSLTELICNFMTRDDWNSVKDGVFKLVSNMTGGEFSPTDIKNSGNKLRCIDMASPLGYDDILTYDGFKDRCAVVGDKTSSQPGRTAVIHDTYLAITRVSEEAPCSLTVYGILLLDKSLNKNINIDLNNQFNYYILPLICDDVYEAIEGYLNNRNVTAQVEKMKIEYLLGKHDAIVTKKGAFVRVYNTGEKLMEGEEIVRSKYKFIN